MRNTVRKATRRSVAVTALLALMMSACGGDDDDAAKEESATTGEETNEWAAACDAYAAADGASLAEDVEGMVAALEDFTAAAPDAVAAAVEPFTALVQEDPEAAMESDVRAVAETAADAFALDSCGGTRLDLNALEYAFIGLPSEIEAGPVVLNLTNGSETGELHEAWVFRKNEGVTDAAADILALGEYPMTSMEGLAALTEQVSIVGVAFVEPEGGDTQDVTVIDLEPGDYVVACLLPENSGEFFAALETGEEVEAGEPHYTLGMVAELTVK